MPHRTGTVARRRAPPAFQTPGMMPPFGGMPATGMGGFDAAGGFPTAGMQPMMQPMMQPQMPQKYPPMPGATAAARGGGRKQAGATAMQQQPAAGALPGSAMQKLLEIERQMKKWEGILTELSEAVFVVCATVVTDNVPFYTELPRTEADLRVPAGTLPAGTKVTLVYPQYPHLGLLFMRARFTNPSTSAIDQPFVPVANMKLPPHQVQALTGINSADAQYLNYFHNPGEADPAVAADDE